MTEVFERAEKRKRVEDVVASVARYRYENTDSPFNKTRDAERTMQAARSAYVETVKAYITEMVMMMLESAILEGRNEFSVPLSKELRVYKKDIENVIDGMGLTAHYMGTAVIVKLSPYIMASLVSAEERAAMGQERERQQLILE